jgi:hypothetical protein
MTRRDEPTERTHLRASCPAGALAQLGSGDARAVKRSFRPHGRRATPAGGVVLVSMAEIEKKIQLFPESLRLFES